MDTLQINIAKEFTETPGPRSPDEGEYSGIDFLKHLLLPTYEEAVRRKAKLIINLDGTAGYATSFLESAFGGLARIHEPKTVLGVIDFISDEEPYLKEEIRGYIREARG